MGFSPKDCVIIEDSTYGAQAARAMGFDVLIYANEQKRKTLVSRVKFIWKNGGTKKTYSIIDFLSPINSYQASSSFKEWK